MTTTTKRRPLDGAALLHLVETAALPARTLSFGELVAAYVANKPPCAPRDYRLARWTAAFGSRVAWEITADKLNAALDGLLEVGYAPATVNREHGEIAAIFNWAIKHRRRTGAPIDFRNPLAGRPKLPEPVRRVQLADEKIERLLALSKVAAYPRMYGLVLAALTSGARRNELRRMTWGNTDLVRGIAQIGVDHKTGQWRTLLLVPALVAELRTYPQSASEHLVFPRSGNPFEPHDERREWRRLRVQIGEPTLHWHDLRHVCTARLLRSGASLHVTSKVLGHTDARMVSRRYGSLETGDLLRAVVAAGEGLG